MSNERTYTTRLLKSLRAEPDVWCVKIHGGSMQQAGLPDIIGVSNGRFFAMEVKQPGNVATPLQVRTLNAITDAGGYARIVLTDGPVEEVVKWLQSFV